MKTQTLILLFIGSLALATNAPVENIWKGSGVSFDQDGKPKGKYEIEVKTSEISNQKHENKITISQGGKTVKKMSCTQEESDNSWESSCSYGSGGGHCFGEGLCLSYVEDAKGNSYATTIVLDGPKTMRLLTTVLKKGKAVKFHREKIHKQ